MSDEIDVSAFMDFALDQSTAPEDIQAVEDANTVGLRFGFIGAGQAGCNLTSVLWENFGYRRAILFNTTESDLGYTAIPQSNHIVPDGFDGAGKQRSRGSEAAVAAKADIFSALHARMKSVDYIFIVTSGGGGTGSGSTPVLAEIATQYVKQTLDCSVEEAQKRVGFIIMLPAASDGAAVRSNAGALLSDLTHEGKSKYGPMLLVDNERIKRMGQGSLSDWQLKSNTVTARLFDIFNALAARNSRISTFDPTDYKSVLSSGIITVGFTMIPKIEQQTTISASIRGNLKNNLLADGLEISTGTHAALIIVADEGNLSSEFSEKAMQRAQETLLALLDNSDEKRVTLHTGVYTAAQKGVLVYSMIGGITIPEKKILSYSR